MKKDLKVVPIQAKVPRNKNEGEKQILRLVKEALTQSVDLIGLPEDCVSPNKDILEGYDSMNFLSSVAKDN